MLQYKLRYQLFFCYLRPKFSNYFFNFSTTNKLNEKQCRIEIKNNPNEVKNQLIRRKNEDLELEKIRVNEAKTFRKQIIIARVLGCFLGSVVLLLPYILSVII